MPIANRQSPIAISNLQSQFQIANRQCNSKSLIANRQSQVCSRSLLQLQVVTPHQVTLLSRSLLQLQIATLSLGRHPSGEIQRISCFLLNKNSNLNVLGDVGAIRHPHLVLTPCYSSFPGQ